MFFRTAQDWWALAQALSLEPHEPSAGYGSAASFRSLKRARAARRSRVRQRASARRVRSRTPAHAALSIATGDPTFDSMFQIQGYPEPYVRQVFAHPDLRATLQSVAAGANELTMNGTGVFWLWPGPALSRTDLDAHVQMAMRASGDLFGTVQSMGPYRA